jgi:hypothetical protein
MEQLAATLLRYPVVSDPEDPTWAFRHATLVCKNLVVSVIRPLEAEQRRVGLGPSLEPESLIGIQDLPSREWTTDARESTA